MTRLAKLALVVSCLWGLFLGQALANTFSEDIMKPFKGDFDQMKKDKVVRVLIPYSITDYYLEGGKEKGLAAEYLREFEKHINAGIRKDIDKIRLVLIPTQRDELLPSLLKGFGDLVVANLTITKTRQDQVDFSKPYRSNVREVVITGPDISELEKLDQLAGLEIHTRASSSYFESLERANATLAEDAKDPIIVVPRNEALEDEDLLEMLNAGVLPAIVMDDYKAKLWAPIFDKIKIHEKLALREEADLAWAFRKNSPELEAVVNEFISKTKIGTELGNIFARRYSSDIGKIINPKTEEYQQKLNELMVLFEAAGAKYDLDPILLAAQAFQESRFNNDAKSHVGAVGIMQVLPSTAQDKNVAIKNFRELEGNIEAGAKYNRFVADRYFDDPEISDLEKMLFVLASYNAGPNRVARVRADAEDPNIWFDQVEWQVAKAAGAEPIKYVKNIFIYYVIFSRLTEYDQNKNSLEKDVQ